SAGTLILNGLGGALQPWLGGMAFVFTSVSAAGLFAVTYAIALGFSLAEWSKGLSAARGRFMRLPLLGQDALARFAEWHGRHATCGGEAEAHRPRRASLKEDMAAEAPADGGMDAEKSILSIIPRRKPVVTPRAPLQKNAAKEERQKKLALRAE